MGQRLTTMTSGQKRFPIAPSIFKFARHGRDGVWVSELLPHTAKVVDDLCIVKSVHTEAINHDPAITYIQTGSQLPGRARAAWSLRRGHGTRSTGLPGRTWFRPVAVLWWRDREPVSTVWRGARAPVGHDPAWEKRRPAIETMARAGRV